MYLFKDARGAVLYVGKAASLAEPGAFVFSRVALDGCQDRLAGSRDRRPGNHSWSDNEREALALENNLIKRYHPKFNVLLRDDKTYPYIKFTAAEKYPRVYFTRRMKKDGSLYFGPYFPASLARRILHFIHKRFLVPLALWI